MTESDRSSRLSQTRQFKDSVHDYVSFSPWICSFIDTKHFQRLRYIKQLGLSYYVFPGASHNRFEHCLGVGYLARLMAKHLRDMDSSLGITDQHIQCVELAGLCHDLGHGPWSHVWDNTFIPAALPAKKGWTHEQASEMMFDDMVETYRLDIDEDEKMLVKALISGKTDRCPLGKEKPFLFEIVANKCNGLDVDKFDYILRDCHAVGDNGNISITRLINSARVVNNNICYDIKDANQIYELFYTRFSLHKRIYNHKTTKSIEFMVIDALLSAERHLKIANRVEDPKRYVYLTDDLLNTIESSDEKELGPAKEIIERIRTRDLYRMVDYKVFAHADKKMIEDNVTPEAIVEVARSGVLDGVDKDLVTRLEPGHVAVSCAYLHYGSKAKNPLDNVAFYSKKNSNVCAKATGSDISLLMPSSFAEVWLRVYTKEEDFYGLIQAAYRHILKGLVSASEKEQTAPAASDGEEEEEGFDPSMLHPQGQAPAVATAEVSPEVEEQRQGADDDPGVALVRLPTAVNGGPVTPRQFTRDLSTVSIGSAADGGGRKPRTMERTGSFTNNAFTSVPPNFRGESPSRKPRREVSESVAGASSQQGQVPVAVAAPKTGQDEGTGQGMDDDLGIVPFRHPAVGDGPPVTPGQFAQNVSTTSTGPATTGGERGSRPMDRTGSFTDNSFTSVPPNFRGGSPSRKPRGKRAREVSGTVEAGPPRKSARLSEKGADDA